MTEGEETLDEDEFVQMISKSAPELTFFTMYGRTDPQHSRSLCSLLALFWLVSDAHVAFTRSQPAENRLSAA